MVLSWKNNSNIRHVIMRIFPVCNSDYWFFLTSFSGGTMRNDATTGFHPRFSPWRSKLEP